MKKLVATIIVLIFVTIIVSVTGSYTNVHSYNVDIEEEQTCRFATSVIEYTGNGDINLILGGPRGAGGYQGSLHVLSLGDNGSVTVGFDVVIANGPGPDFIVFENPFFIYEQNGAVFGELVYVEVSTDGSHFARFPSISLTPPGGMIYPYNVENLAGVNPVYANVDENDIDPCDPNVAGGDAFDLDDLLYDPLVQNELVNLQNINYIRLIDIYGDGSCLDSQGNPIYDPVGYGNSGSDIDAISVVNIDSNQDEWTGGIRIEGKDETIWNGQVTVGPSTIIAKNVTSGQNETFYILYPSVLGALDEASDLGDFYYAVEYWPSWDAFLVTTIGDDSDWWHYWVDDELPMIGCEKYELTENDHQILWGYVEDWYPDILKISVDKNEVNTSEEFTVTVYNRTMYPVEDATVYIGSSAYTTNGQGKITVTISSTGDYVIYAEKDGYVRSEKITITVKTKNLIQIAKPENNAVYFMNRKLKILLPKTTIIGPIDIEVHVTEDVEKVDFYVNNNLKYVDTESPFTWRWDEVALFRKTIKVVAYAKDESQDSDVEEVRIFNLQIIR